MADSTYTISFVYEGSDIGNANYSWKGQEARIKKTFGLSDISVSVDSHNRTVTFSVTVNPEVKEPETAVKRTKHILMSLVKGLKDGKIREVKK